MSAKLVVLGGCACLTIYSIDLQARLLVVAFCSCLLLRWQVQMHNQDQSVKDMKSLSGGEASFTTVCLILALGERKNLEPSPVANGLLLMCLQCLFTVSTMLM